jgi:hypothetical protein
MKTTLTSIKNTFLRRVFEPKMIENEENFTIINLIFIPMT